MVGGGEGSSGWNYIRFSCEWSVASVLFPFIFSASLVLLFQLLIWWKNAFYYFANSMDDQQILYISFERFGKSCTYPVNDFFFVPTKNVLCVNFDLFLYVGLLTFMDCFQSATISQRYQFNYAAFCFVTWHSCILVWNLCFVPWWFLI